MFHGIAWGFAHFLIGVAGGGQVPWGADLGGVPAHFLQPFKNAI